ncbi:MAG: HD-GYP domain-containing protein [Gammaproteobacteria bacterium]
MSTSDLAVGMHVSGLDRPWLDTPFLFQGFTIRTPDEIAALKRYCKFVYVDHFFREAAGLSKARPSASIHMPAKEAANGKRSSFPELVDERRIERPERSDSRRSLFGRLARIVGRKQVSVSSDIHRDVVAVKEELPKAREVISRASSVMTDAMEEIRRGGKLNTEVLESIVNPMVESLMRNRDAMAWLTRIRRTDDYTYGHSVSCSVYAVAFGRHLGLPKEDLNVLGLGGLLLDVGKTQIPKALLAKTDKLSAEESALMRSHTALGERIVQRLQSIDERVVAMVRSHHERYDGSGYPDGLAGPDIPVFARIAGIVDFYDARISVRPYAAPVSSYDAMRQLHKFAGTQFQPEMVDKFVHALGMFSNGCLVELSTGEVGIVIEQNRVRRLRPVVMLILNRDKKPLGELLTIDLRDLPVEPGEEGAVWIDRGLEAGAYGIDPARYFL